MPNCDAASLAEAAKCFSCLPVGTQMGILVYLQCQIANGEGGSCTPTSATISGTDIDWTVADHRYKTILGNTVFTFSNVTEAKTISVYITNVGLNTVGWPATIKWTGAVTPTQTANVAPRTDIYTFVQVNSIIYGSYIQNYV